MGPDKWGTNMFIRKIQIFIRNSLFLQCRFSHVFRARITQITRVISRNASVISSPTVTAAVLHGSDESAILVESKTMAATRSFSSEGNLQREVCSLIAQKSSEAIKDHGFFAVGFSGGSLPKIVCPDVIKDANSKQNDSCAECFDANFEQMEKCARCFP